MCVPSDILQIGFLFALTIKNIAIEISPTHNIKVMQPFNFPLNSSLISVIFIALFFSVGVPSFKFYTYNYSNAPCLRQAGIGSSILISRMTFQNAKVICFILIKYYSSFHYTSSNLLSLLRSFYCSFVLIEKNQKIKAGRIRCRSCHTAMLNFCTTVASALYLYS